MRSADLGLAEGAGPDGVRLSGDSAPANVSCAAAEFMMVTLPASTALCSSLARSSSSSERDLDSHECESPVPSSLLSVGGDGFEV